MAGMVRDMTVNREVLAKDAGSGFATATDLADWLVRVLNLPFRNAHHVSGELVALAERDSKNLDQLTLAEMQAVESGITEEVFAVLSPENSVASRMSFGGTAPARVREAISSARERLS
jgi:argininosuccinate lyase